jgi:hypothetical protein
LGGEPADLANTKASGNTDRFSGQSRERLVRATETKPGTLHKAFHNWVYVLLHWAHSRTGDEGQKLLLATRERCLQAEAIRPGSATYSLACVAAMLGEVEESVALLRKDRASDDPPTRKGITDDRDFAGVLNHPLFQEFLAELEDTEE